jgi:Tfp pilus assembly protein PilN
MTPAKIHLDFVQSRRPSRLLGLGVLSVGLLAAFWVVTEYRNAATELAIADAEMQSRPIGERHTVTAAVDERTSIEANQAVFELAVPWAQLFRELETVGERHGGDVTLLKVEPDRESGTIRLAAESRSLDAALAYVRSLQQGASLSHPTIEQHEILVEQRERPVDFEIVAQWKLRQ